MTYTHINAAFISYVMVFISLSVNVTFLELEPQNVSFPIEYQCCNKTLMNPDHEKCCRENVKRNIMEHIIRKEDLCCGNCELYFPKM